MYLPCFVFPYQRVPGLGYTPLWASTRIPHSSPVTSDASPDRETLEWLAPELWKEKNWELALPSLAQRQELPLRAVCPSCSIAELGHRAPERFTASTVTTSVALEPETASSRYVSSFGFTERRAHGNRGSLEFRHDGEERE